MEDQGEPLAEKEEEASLEERHICANDYSVAEYWNERCDLSRQRCGVKREFVTQVHPDHQAF